MEETMILLNREPAILEYHHSQLAVSYYLLDLEVLIKSREPLLVGM
jgi:hypothetical protein